MDSDHEQNNLTQCAFFPRGYTVLTATSIALARQILCEHEPDIILMETTLPDGDGFEFIAELIDATRASILFVTCKADDKDAVKGLRLGASDYIKKPLHRDLLITRVELAMRHRREWGRQTVRLNDG